jgi:hypothetical protein
MKWPVLIPIVKPVKQHDVNNNRFHRQFEPVIDVYQEIQYKG